MARASPYQGNFGSGEFSPLVRGRTDADRYKSGLARCFNMIPTLQGGSVARPGTKYVNNAKTNAYTRLIPFKFSQTDAYILEFGVGYIRFYTNRGVVTSGGIPYEVTNTYSSDDLKNLSYKQSLDVLYLAVGTQPPQKLSRISATNWTLVNVSFNDGPYLSNSRFPGSTGPRLQAQLAPGGTPMVGTAIDVVPNAITAWANDGTGKYLITLTDSVQYVKTGAQFYVSGATGTAVNGFWTVTTVPGNINQLILQGSTYTAGATGGTARDNSFIPTYIGQSGGTIGSCSAFRFKLSTSATLWHSGVINWVYLVSSQYQGFSLVTDVAPGSLVEITEYRLPAYGVFTPLSNGVLSSPITSFPSCVNFFEDRLFFGGAGGALQRIDGSKTGDYENFGPSEFAQGSTADNTVITDQCALAFSTLSGQSSQVRWMTSDEKGMCVGTSDGSWIVRPSALNQALTPTNISAKAVTSFGSSKFGAVVAGKASIFIEASLRRVRELAYFYDVDGFRTVDLSELSEHLPASGIATEVVFQNTPQNIIWCGRADGALLGITYDRTLDTLRTGWHWHYLGGRSDVAGTPPVVESLAAIPSPDGTYDDVWMTVKRYVNGTTFRSIEYLTKIFEVFNDPEDAFFVDCGATYDAPATFSGLTVSNAVVTVTSTAHGLSTGNQIRFRKISGLNDASGNSLINGFLFNVTVVDANTFTVTLSAAPTTPYAASSNAVYRKMVHTISGLTWLEGETVQVLGDGADLGDFVVSGGAITLPGIGAGTVQVGLGNSAELQQLRLDAGSQDGTSFGKTRRINEVLFMVDRTASFEYGVNFSQMFLVDFRKPLDPVDQATPLFTGITNRLNVASDYDTENQIAIRQARPLPLTLLAIMPQQVVQDKG